MNVRRARLDELIKTASGRDPLPDIQRAVDVLIEALSESKPISQRAELRKVEP